MCGTIAAGKLTLTAALTAKPGSVVLSGHALTTHAGQVDAITASFVMSSSEVGGEVVLHRA